MYVRRKVYSYSEPEEQLYSVTMTEDEYDLFSAVLDEYYDDYYDDYDLYSDDVERRRDIGALIGGGVGLAGAAGAGAAGYYNREKIAKKITDSATKRRSAINREIKAAQDASASIKADYAEAQRLREAYANEYKAITGPDAARQKRMLRKKYEELANKNLEGKYTFKDLRNKNYIKDFEKKNKKLLEDLGKKKAQKGLGEGALETWRGLSRNKKAAVAAGVLGAGALTAGAAGRAIGGATSRK